SGGSCPAKSRPAIREIGSIRSSPNSEVILATKPSLDIRPESSEYAPGTPPGAYFSVEATGRAVAVAYGPGSTTVQVGTVVRQRPAQPARGTNTRHGYGTEARN